MDVSEDSELVHSSSPLLEAAWSDCPVIKCNEENNQVILILDDGFVIPYTYTPIPKKIFCCHYRV